MILEKDFLDSEVKGPAYWYIGSGGYGNWNGDSGLRLPVGVEWYFEKKLDVYGQLIPHLKIVDTLKFGFDFGFGVRYQF